MKKHFQTIAGGILAIALLASTSNVMAFDLLENWSGDIFAGYNSSSGNTEKASGSMSASAVKQLEESKITLKGSLFYSESDEKMDGQKWDGLAKYDFDFGETEKWFNFYQVYVDHDYFADIDYRITPSAGLGYHIAASEDWTWDVDGGLGYRITRHRINDAKDDEVAVAQAHTFMKKKILSNAFISEDFTIFPGLESDAGYTLKSITTFANPLTENMDLEIKYILDFDSEPASGKKKTDTQFIAGIKYKF